MTERPVAPAYLAELAGSGRYRAVGHATTTGQAVEAVQGNRPDVVVAEVVSLARVEELGRELTKQVPTVMVSALEPEAALMAALTAGARGFVLQPVEHGLVDQAVSAVAAGRMFVDPRSAGWLVELALRGHLARTGRGLSLRQEQVLRLVRNGLSNREIAACLGVSMDTVKTHLHDAMQKLGAHDRWDAAERGLEPQEGK